MSKDLKSVIDSVQEELANGSIYSYWIRFTIGKLVIDTSEQTNLFISLENRKSGVKKANCFTLNIAYVPNVSYTDNTFGDVNYIDKCIAESNMNCTLRYGYGDISKGLITGTYTGMVLEYSKEINGAMMNYTIKGYSNLIEANESVINEDNFKDMRPTEVAKEVLKKYLPEYEIEIDPSAYEKDTKLKEIVGAKDKYLFEYIDTVLKLASDQEEQSDPNTEINYVYYTYTVEDYEEKKIKIVRLDNRKKSNVSIVFNWMDRSNSVVISFKPNYNGYVLHSIVNSKVNNLLKDSENEESGGKGIAVDGAGETISTESITGSNDIAGVDKLDLQVQKSLWSEAVATLPYTATMILVGIPYEIKIMEQMKIVPLIYGVEDMSAGYYSVTEVVDNIDSSGFTTTLELFKTIDDSNSVKDFASKMRRIYNDIVNTIKSVLDNINNYLNIRN